MHGSVSITPVPSSTTSLHPVVSLRSVLEGGIILKYLWPITKKSSDIKFS